MQVLPTIDLRAVSAGGDHAAAEARRLDHACRRLGMFEVVGHSVAPTLTKSLFAVTREFFALPADRKAQVAQPEPDQVRGWSGVGSEGLAYSLDEESPADLKEKMDMGPPVRTGPGDYYRPERYGPHLAANLWLPEPAGMRQLWEKYYAHMDSICARLMVLCALAFGLPPEFFDDKIDRSISMLRALYYPDQPEPPLSGQMRAGVHSDYGTFTVMTAEDRPGGLQLLERSGEWAPVAMGPNRVGVGVGDLFAEWTADEWPSTLHRVVNPPRMHALDSSRLAFAFYAHPNYDVHVDILPPFRGGDVHPPGFGPTAGDHLREKYLRQTTFGRQVPPH